MIALQEHAQAALVEAIAQELSDLGYRPAATASYIRQASAAPMKVVAPETWATMRELLAAAEAMNASDAGHTGDAQLHDALARYAHSLSL